MNSKYSKLDDRPADIASHNFLYDCNDLAAMHGKLGMLSEMGGAQGLAWSFRSNLDTGLYHDEGGFEKRIEAYGQNLFPKPPLKSFLAHCWDCFEDPILLLLLAAGVLSLILGWLEGGHAWIEGAAILVAVFLVTVVGAGNNYSQELQFQKLDEQKEKEKSIVIRNGKSLNIDQEEIKVGDIVQLAAGDEIPADGVLITPEPVKCNESKMTGENLDVVKDFNHPFFFAGTEMRQGECKMLTVAVGINSAYGRIMQSLSVETESTPLQKKLEIVAATIGWIGATVALVVFVTLTSNWAYQMVDGGLTFVEETEDLLNFFITAVTIIVVAVPEGLPLAVTVTLAFSMKQMFKDQILVRVLAACETMGNCTTICSDKTGTLTMNKMTVVKCVLGGKFYEQIPTSIDHQMKRLLIEGVVLNSKANCEQDNEDKSQPPETWTWKEGNQTECALMAWIVRYNVHLRNERESTPPVKVYPFDSVKKSSSNIVQTKTGLRRYYKGASEKVLEASTKWMTPEGDIRPMDDAAKSKLSSNIDALTSQGLRTIGFGYYDLPEVEYDDTGRLVDPDDVDELVFYGVVGIKDPLRAETTDSVRQCQKAGVVVRMVTGDHVDTAKFIARECGILTSPDHVFMTGDQFRKLVNGGNEQELERVIPKLRVLARSKPEDKETLVNWLKDHGEVVAATGDGTNDAPALKAANIGVAMFIVGTQVAKSAAEINILDDNFASIVKCVSWGRSVFDNIRKFIQFQLTINIVALSVSLVGAISTLFVDARNEHGHIQTTPLTAVQLLWVNLIMDTMAALAFGTEPPTDALLERMPYEPNASLVSPPMWRNIFGQGILQVTVCLGVLYFPDVFFPDTLAQYTMRSTYHYTLIFNSFVMLQVFNEIPSRKVNGELNVFENFFTNYTFHAILAITMICQWMMVELAGEFAQTVGLSLRDWGICIFIGFFSIPWGFIIRIVPVNLTSGRRSVPKSTFDGADWL